MRDATRSSAAMASTGSDVISTAARGSSIHKGILIGMPSGARTMTVLSPRLTPRTSSRVRPHNG